MVYLSGNSGGGNPARNAPPPLDKLPQHNGNSLPRAHPYTIKTPSSRPARAPRLLACLALAACLVLAATAAMAQNLALGNLILDNQAGSISVRFGVRIHGVSELEADLAAGAVMGLRCEADMYLRKSLWRDTRVAGTTLVSPLRKDVLANDYVIELPGEGRTLRDKDLGALLDKAWGRIALDLGPWETLLPGRDYRLDMRIAMDRLDVPDWLRYVVFFWSFDVSEPVHYRMDFSY